MLFHHKPAIKVKTRKNIIQNVVNARVGSAMDFICAIGPRKNIELAILTMLPRLYKIANAGMFASQMFTLPPIESGGRM